MGGKESPYPSFLWRRWDSDDHGETLGAEQHSDRRLFEFCAVPFAGDPLFEDRASRPRNTTQSEHAGDADEFVPEPVYFLPPFVRLVLRHVPTLVSVFLVLVLVEGELDPATRGVSTLLPELQVVPLGYLAIAASVLLFVLVHSEVIKAETLVKAVFVYGLGTVLLAGSAYGTYLTLETRGGTETVPHVVYTFPTLLFTLVIGLLAYDLLLKGEHLYTHLGQKNIILAYRSDDARDHSGDGSETETGNEPRTGETGGGDSRSNGNGDERVPGYTLYEQIKGEKLTPKLGPVVGPFRYGHLFAFLVLSQYLLIWSFKGPLGTGLWSSLALNVTVNLVVLVGVFNFLIGILFLRNLLNGQHANEDGVFLQPRYLPFHPDRQGGYADIGSLAMRINVIFILIGAYYVYRAYISGIRAFPDSAPLSFEPLYAGVVGIDQTPVLEMVFWTVNFVGPVFLYVVVVTIWFYYTFWDIHGQMAEQKKELILKKQKQRGDDEPTGNPRDSPIGNYEDRENWMALYDAPEWPVNTQKLGGLVTGNVVPILMSIPTVVPDLLSVWG